MSFKIAPNLTLPASAVSETFAEVGTRGSGKTYLAGKIVEEFVDGGAQVVVVDPVGVWGRGLRLAADGRSAGLAIPVFGGWSGDLPLEPTGGELVAGLVAQRGLAVVLDISEMTLGEQHRFVTRFATVLFHLKKRNRSPLHVVLEEAHEFLPQVVSGGEAEMVGAVKRLWKIGRNFGIGGSLISQRPAEINKGALNLTSMMFCGKLKGPQDRKAIEAWARDQDADDAVLADLHKLAPGDMVHWTDKGPIRIRCFPKRTFDVSRTPEGGEDSVGALLPIDIGEVREAMKATIAEAAANDPKALRARIAELEAARPNAEAAAQIGDLVAKLREFEGATPAEVRRLRTMETFFEPVIGAVDAYRKAGSYARTDLSHLVGAEAILVTGPPRPPAETPVRLPPGSMESGQRPDPRRRPTGGPRDLVRIADPGRRPRDLGQEAMPLEVRRLMTALSQFAPAAITRRKVAALTGYPSGGSSMRKALAFARARSWVADHPDGSVAGLSAGFAALGRVDPLPTGAALRSWWQERLPMEMRLALGALCASYPKDLSREALAAATGYPQGGSSMRKALAGLRGRDLVVDRANGDVGATPDLFEARR